MARLKVKNWKEHQHYKGRSPPWIKLHKRLLDDFEFNRLPIASRALAPMLWLMASESKDGTVTDQPSEIAFRLRLNPKEVEQGLQPLIDYGFLESTFDCKQDASVVLATCLPRVETETETETDKKKHALREKSLAPAPAVPESPFVAFVRSEWPDVKDPADIERRAREAFPAVELLSEAKRARGWEASDPKRRKHNHGRFLWGWFGRSQDNASKSGQVSLGAVTPSAAESAARIRRQEEEYAAARAKETPESKAKIQELIAATARSLGVRS